MEERFKVTKKAGIYGIIGNVFLLAIKAIIGFTSKSQAMIADSINSAGDIFASLMTSIGNKIASVPGDEDHNFGHGKAEYIFSLFIAISMIIVSVKMIIDAIRTLFEGNEIIFSWWAISSRAYIASGRRIRGFFWKNTRPMRRTIRRLIMCLYACTIISEAGLISSMR